MMGWLKNIRATLSRHAVPLGLAAIAGALASLVGLALDALAVSSFFLGQGFACLFGMIAGLDSR